MASRRKRAGEVSKSSKESQRNPSAAVRERERLRIFNESLESLQNVIPIRLPAGRKLHKKQTLQLACRYITFLRECIDGKRDWEERPRFWCSNDDDHQMIDAIDAASRNVEPSPAPKRVRRKRVTSAKTELCDEKTAPPPNVQVVPVGPWATQRSPTSEVPTVFTSQSSASTVSEAVQFSNALLAAHSANSRHESDDKCPPFPAEYYKASSTKKQAERPGLDEVWSDLNEIISNH